MSVTSSQVRFPVLRTEIAGVPVADLARQFGTPLYVYDEAMIARRIAELRSFDVIRFAQKACSNLAILALARRCGALIDCVSAGEIHRALKAGYEPQGDPPPVVYTADVFDRAALDMVLDQGIHVNCGSPEMIEQYGARRPGAEITLRINPGFGHGHSQKTNTGGEQSKHGIWHEQLSECLRAAEYRGLTVTGLHMHIGSGADMEHLRRVCDAMERAALEAGRCVTSISTGGGLPTVYKETDQHIDVQEYFALWDATRKRLEERFGHAVRLEIEPGRYLVAESGYLVSEIRAVKKTGGNSFYLVDAGFNNLARPILYGAYHPISICRVDGRTDASTSPVIVAGPLCESGDVFTQTEGGYVAPRPLPEAAVGDYAIFECAGAYGFVMGSNYNSKPLAAEVLVSHGLARIIRERQSLDDLIRGEHV